jgi:hypothetical protein
MVESPIAENLWINLTRRGWKKKEPLEEAIAVEEPRLLGNAFIAINKSVGIDAFSKSLGLSPRDYERFAGLQRNSLSVSMIPEFNPRHRAAPRDSKLA